MKTLITYSVLLFALMTSLSHDANGQEAEPENGKQVERIFKTSDGAEVKYLIYVPENYDSSGEIKVPFMLFLHGRGESNGPLNLVAKWGPPKKVAAGEDWPFLMVSPQCPAKDWWSSETQLNRLKELVDHISEKCVFNEQKMCLTGLSMGGYGAWALANKHPKKFSAVVPVCGGGKAEFAENLKDTPIWAWHGDEDGAVPFKLSVEMVDAIKAAGGTSIKFTSLEGIGHNCWSAAYATPQLYQWMLQQTNKAD